jgi:peroxiredoxin
MELLAVALLGACQSSKVRISGRLVGADAHQVYIEEVTSGNKPALIDSVSLDENGNFKFLLKNIASTPSLYNIYYNGETVPVLISGGDRLTVNSAGSFARNYTVEGNEESMLLMEFNKAYIEGAERLNKISTEYGRSGQDKEQQKKLAKKYFEEYKRIKKTQLEFIIKNKSSVAAVYALSQRLPGDQYLFNGANDVVYYRTVAEALEESYPESPYLIMLHAEISRLDALQNLSSQITESGYPDLELVNMYGKKVRLSSLKGKVILVDFWSPSLGNSNVLNADLKQTYKQYHDKGFEVYQVAIEKNRATWVNAIQEQGLPWVSVSDLQGDVSTTLTLYNVRTLPANYLINKDGDIVAKNIYGQALEQQLETLL